MRGNDILLLHKKEGERGIIKVLLRLAEEAEERDKTIKEMASAFETLVRVQTMLNGVADGLKDKLDAMQKRDDDPRSTHEMIRSKQ